MAVIKWEHVNYEKETNADEIIILNISNMIHWHVFFFGLTINTVSFYSALTKPKNKKKGHRANDQGGFEIYLFRGFWEMDFSKSKNLENKTNLKEQGWYGFLLFLFTDLTKMDDNSREYLVLL